MRSLSFQRSGQTPEANPMDQEKTPTVSREKNVTDLGHLKCPLLVAVLLMNRTQRNLA
jgi:hypothetical protein